MSLIQLVPTAGGSFRARFLGNPLIGRFVPWPQTSAPPRIPTARLRRNSRGAEGNQQFFGQDPPWTMRTILLQGGIPGPGAGTRESAPDCNGIGTDVTVIGGSAGVTHENFPTHPVGLEFLGKALARTARSAVALELSTSRAREPFLKRPSSGFRAQCSDGVLRILYRTAGSASFKSGSIDGIRSCLPRAARVRQASRTRWVLEWLSKGVISGIASALEARGAP